MFVLVAVFVHTVARANGAVLTADVRKVNALASGGVLPDQQTFQATFGQNPFSATATASSSGPTPGFPLGSVTATASLTTAFTPNANGFQEFTGNGSASTQPHPDYFGGAFAESLVDVTFHVDTPDFLHLLGHTSTQLVLSRVGGATIYTAPTNGQPFAFGTVLTTGDYRFVSDLQLNNPFAGGAADFQFDLSFGVPEPSSLVLIACAASTALAWRRFRRRRRAA